MADVAKSRKPAPPPRRGRWAHLEGKYKSKKSNTTEQPPPHQQQQQQEGRTTIRTRRQYHMSSPAFTDSSFLEKEALAYAEEGLRQQQLLQQQISDQGTAFGTAGAPILRPLPQAPLNRADSPTQQRFKRSGTIGPTSGEKIRAAQNNPSTNQTILSQSSASMRNIRNTDNNNNQSNEHKQQRAASFLRSQATTASAAAASATSDSVKAIGPSNASSTNSEASSDRQATLPPLPLRKRMFLSETELPIKQTTTNNNNTTAHQAVSTSGPVKLYSSRTRRMPLPQPPPLRLPTDLSSSSDDSSDTLSSSSDNSFSPICSPPPFQPPPIPDEPSPSFSSVIPPPISPRSTGFTSGLRSSNSNSKLPPIRPPGVPPLSLRSLSSDSSGSYSNPSSNSNSEGDISPGPSPTSSTVPSPRFSTVAGVINRQSPRNSLHSSPRNNTTTTTTTITTTTTPREEYRMVLDELINTEADYVADLSVLSDVWVKEFQDRKLMSTDDVMVVFLYVEQIKELNTQLLESLRTIGAMPMAELDFSAISTFIEFLKLYTYYCTNYARALERLEALQRQFPGLLPAMEEIRNRPECKQLDLYSYLIKPLQRLTKYPLLLSQLMKALPDTHKNYDSLRECYERMTAVLSDINENQRLAENLNKLRSIQSLLDEPIISPFRKFVKEGQFKRVVMNNKSTIKNCHLFLFNDSIILAKVNSKRGKKYICKSGGLLPLSQMTVWEAIDDKKLAFTLILRACNGVHSNTNGFNIVHSNPYTNLTLSGPENRFVIPVDTLEERHEWVAAINDAIRLQQATNTRNLPKEAPTVSTQAHPESYSMLGHGGRLAGLI